MSSQHTGSRTEHGTYSRYCNHMCRCEPCREAAKVYVRKLKDKAKAKSYGHGTPAMFIDKECRCRLCKDALAKHKQIRKSDPRKASVDDCYARARRLAQELSELGSTLTGQERRLVGSAELRAAEIAELLNRAYAV